MTQWVKQRYSKNAIAIAATVCPAAKVASQTANRFTVHRVAGMARVVRTKNVTALTKSSVVCNNQNDSQRRSRALEYMCWALALLCFLPLATAVGSRMLYASAAEQMQLAHSEVNEPAPEIARSGVATAVAGTDVKQDQSLWARTRRAAFARLTVNGLPATVAVLRIPQLQATIPVFNGATEAAMTLGAGHLSDTTALTGEGNIALSSHRDGAFRILKDVSKGDALTLTTDAGVRTFIVKKLFIVEPSEVSVLAPTPTTTLTLITCHPFYFVGNAPRRYIVQAELDDKLPTATEHRHQLSL